MMNEDPDRQQGVDEVDRDFFRNFHAGQCWQQMLFYIFKNNKITFSKADFSDHYKVSNSNRSENKSHIEERENSIQDEEEFNANQSQSDKINIYQEINALKIQNSISEPENPDYSEDIMLPRNKEVGPLSFIINRKIHNLNVR